ncbi:MAG: bifunctional YncE family protein/alkaline phosphatase family protein [Deltaproteobacteria bacterium]
MSRSNKSRWILGSLLSGAAAVAVAAQAQTPPLVGRQANGSVLLTTNQTIKPAGKQIEFRGRPMAVVLHPDGRTAALLNGTFQAITIVEIETGVLKQEFDAAGSSASFAGLAYSRDGQKLYASQASGQVLIANVAADGTLALDGLVSSLPRSSHAYPGREDGNPYPGGLALTEDGKQLVVALNRNNSLAVVDLQTRVVVREIPVGNAPHAVVVVGRKAYVSNQAGRPATAQDFTQDSSGTAIVASVRSGYAASGTVSIVDLARGVVTKSIEVGLQPTALLASGERLFVANSNSDSVSIIDLASQRVIKTLATTPFPGAAFGSSPNGLALSSDDRLVVSLGRNNALALYDVGGKAFRAARFLGLIPTGWYPTSVALDERGSRLVVANGKGVGSLGPEATVGPDPASNRTGKWVHSNLGSASIIPLPDRRELWELTQQVFANNSWDKIDGHGCRGSVSEKLERSRLRPLPECTGAPSVFKHVFYIIKENRTYDQVFGDLPQGNGDPTLVQFGAEVTPNHHALAEEFVLLDNLYDSGSLSADGHQWATQAFVTDYVEKAFGGFTRSYPFNGGDSLTYARTGFLWDNALRQGKSVRVYGEYINGLRADGQEMGPWAGTFLGHGETTAGVWSDFYRDAQLLAARRDDELHVKLQAHTEIPSLAAVMDEDYPPYHQIVPDQYRVEVFLREFEEYVAKGNLPELVMMALTSDHTEGTTANYPTPRAMVADNDLALGRVVEAISNSPYWKDSVIFVIEDDAQNGVDHVDGHRTLGFVVSPYTRRGAVDSHYYTQIDMVRAMEQILGLPPMNQMDMAVEPTSMRDVFKNKPNFRKFRARPNQIPLDELNPAPAKLSGLPREWAIASAQLDFSKPDAADERLLNRAIWYSTTHFKRPYPGDPRILSPREVTGHLPARTRPTTEVEAMSQPSNG